MNTKAHMKTMTLAVLIGVLALGAAAAALADPMTPAGHPRQVEVLGRAAHQRAEVRREERVGRISPMKAHRLLVAERRVAHEDRRLSRQNGGHISKAEHRRLNRDEDRLGRRIRG